MKNLKFIKLDSVEASFKNFDDFMNCRDFEHLTVVVELSDGTLVTMSEINYACGQCDCCEYDLGDRTIVGYTTFVTAEET